MSESILDEVRGFLSSLKDELPDLFRPKPKPLPRSDAAPAPRVPEDHRERARAVFHARVAHWSALMEVKPNRIFVKEQRTLWGSCSTEGNLNFNWRLLLAPPEVLDYVVIHELAHLREMNHSKRFWAIVEAWCPEQKTHRKWLRLNHRAVWAAPIPPAS